MISHYNKIFAIIEQIISAKNIFRFFFVNTYLKTKNKGVVTDYQRVSPFRSGKIGLFS